MNSPEATQWLEALSLEIKQIESHGTWERREIEKSKDPLSTNFVFKKKLNVIVEVSRCKVRLVVNGYKQTFRIDSWDTYAPVVDYDVAITILGYFTSKAATTNQVDFVMAFLNGDIEEEIYLTLPSGYDSTGCLYKLKKSLYGLT